MLYLKQIEKTTKKYYIKNVLFNISLEEYVSIRKHQRDFSLEKHLFQTRSLELPQFSTPEADIINAWETVQPLSPIKAIQKFSGNATQFMIVLSIMGPEATFKALKSKIIDQQTIVKKQIRTFIKDNTQIDFQETKKQLTPTIDSNIFEKKEVTYNDTYTLYEIDSNQFNLNLESPIYILKVNCPSTHENYFIFVDSDEPQCQDAIGAVAWTMVKDNGKCLTKKEYLELKSES